VGPGAVEGKVGNGLDLLVEVGGEFVLVAGKFNPSPGPRR
jgi:hypothetical protein